MLFNIVIGGVGSGKSEYIEERIEESISGKRNALVIVPERFSHIEEATLCEKFGGLGLNGVEVTTFSKISARLAKLKEYLMPSGREMLVLKAVKKCQKEGDGIFEGAYEHFGFIGEVSTTISELKKSLITPDMLKSYNGGGLLEKKTAALGAIYAEYNSLVKGVYSDPDENMSELAKNIEHSSDFLNTDVFIDGFSDFMSAHYEVIEAFIGKSHSVTVALTLNSIAERNPDGIFAPVMASFIKLGSIAKKLGISYNVHRLEGEYQYINAEDIRYFLKNYDEYSDLSLAPKCENIKLQSFSDRHSEVMHMAGRIMYEVRTNKVRFRDIGVIIGNSDAYLHIIESVFSAYNIPYSADVKLAATEHPVIRLVLSVFKIITDNWSYASVFEYLSSGFLYQKTDGKVGLYDRERIDKLELYVKEKGIRGRKVWLSETAWSASKARIFDEATGGRDTNVNIELIDEIRRELMAPFISFTEKIKGRQKVAALAKALFEFLEEIYLFEGLQLEKKAFEEKNMLDEAARIATVWDIILTTLDQCVMTSGNEYMSRDDFYNMLETGLSKCSIDMVPSGSDRVAVSGVDTNRPVRVKALFVIGAVRGEFPQEVAEFGIITAADRIKLAAAGFENLPDRTSSSQIAEFNVFSSLTAGYEKLYVSYPEQNDDGGKNTYAQPINELLRFFDKADLCSGYDKWEDIFASKKNAYNILLSRFSDAITDGERQIWDALWDCVKPEAENFDNIDFTAKNGDYSVFDDIEATRLDLLREMRDSNRKKNRIRPETAALLYGERSFSISALQKFNKCPFSYFADYGLKLCSDEEQKVGAADIGTMVHWAVCEYCKAVQKNADTHSEKRARWISLDKEKSDKIISDLTEHIEKITKDANPDFTPERIELICKKSENTLKRATEIIRLSFVEGEFAAYEFEKPFRFTIENKRGSIELGGIIDRADIAETDSGRIIRVIDYKTGSQSFSVAGIYNKTDLQLLVYALAAEELYKEDNAKVGAVMYNKITEELTKTEYGSPIAISSASLDGIIVHADDKKPHEEIYIHSKELTEGSKKSNYLPISTNKDGSVKKTCPVISRSKYNILAKYVAKTAIDTKCDIYSGKIGAMPLGEGDRSPCRFCEYSVVCMYDKLRDGVRVPVTSAAKAWEKLDAEELANE